MHAAEREAIILYLLASKGFVSFRDLDEQVSASPATIRRDLERLQAEGKLVRVRGGVRSGEISGDVDDAIGYKHHLAGTPFHVNVTLNRAQKEAIGREAAKLCVKGESVIIDGGSTTLNICPHIADLSLQVMTNSLHIASALITQRDTKILVPAGILYREQNIILSPFEDDGMERFCASKLFLGAAAIGRHGLMQDDPVLVQAEQRLLKRADRVIVVVDSSKFDGPAGYSVCALDAIDTIITDAAIAPASVAMLGEAGVKLIIAGNSI